MVEIFRVLLPAIVTAIVGGLTIWLGLRQLRETARISSEQLKQSAESAREQMSAQLSAAHLAYRAQVLSANRQAWINDVRNVVSELIAIMERHRISIDDHDGISWKKIEQFERSLNKLRLLLNPSEDNSKQIIVHAQKLRECAEQHFKDTAAYSLARESLFEAASRVLKEEWERVKQGS